MTFDKRVIDRLNQLATDGPEGVQAVQVQGQPGYIVGLPAEEGQPSAALTLADFDRYSATLRQLEVRLTQPDAPDLDAIAADLTERLTYLEEPLTVLELDSNLELAQVRSDPPQTQDEAVTYWEALVRPGQINLSRYRWQPGLREREPIVYPATFATLGRLARDLAESLQAR